jgi:hypothetical protein
MSTDPCFFVNKSMLISILSSNKYPDILITGSLRVVHLSASVKKIKMKSMFYQSKCLMEFIASFE